MARNAAPLRALLCTLCVLGPQYSELVGDLSPLHLQLNKPYLMNEHKQAFSTWVVLYIRVPVRVSFRKGAVLFW